MVVMLTSHACIAIHPPLEDNDFTVYKGEEKGLLRLVKKLVQLNAMVIARPTINTQAIGVKQLENENHLLLIIIVLLVVAAFVVGDSNVRNSKNSDELIQAGSASQPAIIGH